MIEIFYYLIWLFIFFVPEIFPDKLFFSEKLINKYILLYNTSYNIAKQKIKYHYLYYSHCVPAVIFSFHNIINPSSKLFPMIKYNATAYVISDCWVMYNKKQSTYNGKIKTLFLIYHHLFLLFIVHLETQIFMIDYFLFFYDFKGFFIFLSFIHTLNSNHKMPFLYHKRRIIKYYPIINNYFSFPFISCLMLYMLYSNMSNSFISQRTISYIGLPMYFSLFV